MTGSAVVLTTDETMEMAQVVLKAPEGNVGPVYLGAAGVTTADGFEALPPGEFFQINNDNRAGEVAYDVQLHTLYLVGNSGDVVSWLAWVQ
jgi:hypothetical protein